ncbi:phospho-N-acetylmuramoyl-pentapeptide-transferase [Leptolyngbya sp. FACHB-261]|nr:phospho-N-acetylmuramoyl-pentapeptide-transferase [Leptolyngbya sp. FACHB-261]
MRGQLTSEGVRSSLTLIGVVSLTALGLDLWQSQLLLTLPLLLSLVLSALAGQVAIPWLQALKAGQFIREDGPRAHLKKAGTPTMGGIFWVPVAVVVALLWTGFAPGALLVSVVTLAYAAIGWIDDWQVIRKKSNRGISPSTKLALQIAVAVLFCGWLKFTNADLTTLALPLGLSLPLGLLFWPLAGFVMVAESNAVNLTDGLDGLAAGTGALAFLGLGALMGTAHPDLAVFCAAFSGAALGFLVHNRNPARVFMGDTGSLAMGGALAATAILGGNLWGLLLLSGIYVLEAVSVIAQVTYYKATKGPDGVGKRLFRMAPFHHHLELEGWSETQVVSTFYLVSAGLVLLAILLA